jgi:ribosome-associated protein
MTSSDKVTQIVKIADDMKAERIETLDVKAKTSIADYFVLCTGNSDRHVSSIVDRVSERMSELQVKPLRTEGERSGWILLDYGDVILHVMREEERQFYDLETLWKTTQPDPNLTE